MARINIEDSLFKDARFFDLALRLGSRRAALGAVTEAYMVAQRYWLNGKRPVPRPAFDRELEPLLLDVGLAELTADGDVYIKGSEDQFAWLFQRSEAGKKGGPAAAKTRVDKKGKTNRRKSSEAQRGTSEDVGSRPLTLSLSHSLSLSPAQAPSQTQTQEEETKNTAAPSATSATNVFIAAYCEAYRTRKGSAPVIDGAQAGAAKRAVKALGIGRATALLETYLAWPEPWFVKRGHDLQTFAGNLNRIVEKHDTGKVTTDVEARQAERGNALHDQLRRIAEGKV